MTTPVQEPTAQRNLSGLGWGERQLARRPAPPSGAPSPMPWVRRVFTTGFNSGNIDWGGDNVLGYLDGGTEGHASVTGSTDWTTYWSFPTSNQTEILVPGTYLMSGQIHWDNPTTESHVIILADGYLWETVVSEYVGDSSFEDPSQGFTFVHRYPAPGGGGNVTVQMHVQISGGSNESASSWYFEIMRMGDYSGADPGGNSEE